MAIVAGAAVATVPFASVASAQPAWSAPTTMDLSSPSSSPLNAVSCATATFCAAVDGSGNGLTYDGSHWSAASAIDPGGDLTSVSCPTATRCVAVDNAGNAVVYDDGSWSPPAGVDPDGHLTAVSCATATFCMAVDTSGNLLTYDGSSWSSPTSIDSNGLNSLSCATTSFCGAGDTNGDALTTTDGGVTWPSSHYSYTGHSAVSCPTTGFCVGIGANDAVTYSAGSWSSPTSVGGSVITSVSCATATFCDVVDVGGDVATYDGSSWSSLSNIDDDGSGLNSVSCVSTTFCAAVDANGDALTYDGSVWSPVTEIDGTPGYLTSVSCPVATFCTAVDGNGNVFTYDGTSWSAPTSIDPGGSGLGFVSCPTANFCAAVDANGDAYTYDGSSWSAPTQIDSPDNGVSALSCASAGFCVAVDGNGDAVTYDGSSWSAADTIDPGNGGLNSVSCPTANFCAAVDANGNVLTYDGTSWSTPDNVDTNAGLDSVSCPTSSFCAAADGGGDVLTYDGSTWTAPDSVDSGLRLESVSCVSATFCAAVDSRGDAVIYDGGDWAVSTTQLDANLLTSVSCVSATLCVAVDDNGSALTYTAPAPPTISSVAFGGSQASPTVTISGSGFGTLTELGSPVESCGNGSDFGNNLYIGDATQAWSAGQNNADAFDCVGLIISSYSDSQIVFSFDDEYETYPVALESGDDYTVDVLDTAFSGTVSYGAMDSPSVTTVLSPPGPVTVGASVSDQATLNGASPTAGGTVSYGVYSDTTCTHLVAALGTETVTDGVVGSSIVWTATPTGNYWFQATYSGDASDTGPVSSACSSEPLVVNPAPLAVSTTSLPGAVAGQGYDTILAGSGGTTPYTWSISTGSLPGGLSLDASTGEITGTPASSGTTNFTVMVTDAGTPTPQTATKALSIDVSPNPNPLFVSTTALPGAVAGEGYDTILAGSGGTTPYTWSISTGSLPGGLSLDASTGEITGTPASSGTAHFTVEVTDAGTPTPQTATKALSIAVSPAPNPLSVATNSLPPATVGEGYESTMAASGGTTPYTWSLSSGSLPAGLSLDASTGKISGVPTSSGTVDFTVEVTDSGTPTPQTATKALSLTVRPAVLAVSTVSLPGATVGAGYDATLTASGGTPPYAWSLSTGSLPGGLSLDGSTGEITGTPTTSGTADFSVMVTDAGTPTAQTATEALSIDVSPISPLYVSDVSPSNGTTLGGTSVTISGAGFVDVMAVQFNGVDARSFAVSTSSEITAVSPAEAAGTVDITVTTSTGTSETNSADEFTYTASENQTAQCSAGTSCSDSVSTPLDDSTITVSGTATTSSSSVTIDLTVNADTLSCGSSYDYSTAVSTLSASGFSSGAFLTVTEEVGNEPSVKGVKVCFEGSNQTTATFLRPCKGKLTKPCLQSLREETGGVVATFVVPANDPRFWAGGAPVILKSFSPSHGIPGSTVTLKGQNLTGVVNVVIGGATATIDSVASKKMVVSVPGNALSGTISVTAASGTSTSTSPFTVT